jgi:hypothetical protein
VLVTEPLVSCNSEAQLFGNLALQVFNQYLWHGDHRALRVGEERAHRRSVDIPKKGWWRRLLRRFWGSVHLKQFGPSDTEASVGLVAIQVEAAPWAEHRGAIKDWNVETMLICAPPKMAPLCWPKREMAVVTA